MRATTPGSLLFSFVGRNAASVAKAFCEWAALLIVFAIFLGALVWIARTLLQFSSTLHWLAGLLATVIALIALLLILRVLRAAASDARLRRSLFGTMTGRESLMERHPALSISLLIACIVFLSIYVMATASNILQAETDLISYSRPASGGASTTIAPDELAPELLDYYGWHAIDLIPILNIWQAFEVSEPLEDEGVLAGPLVILFRVFIVTYALAIVQAWVHLPSSRTPRQLTVQYE